MELITFFPFVGGARPFCFVDMLVAVAMASGVNETVGGRAVGVRNAEGVGKQQQKEKGKEVEEVVKLYIRDNIQLGLISRVPGEKGCGRGLNKVRGFYNCLSPPLDRLRE